MAELTTTRDIVAKLWKLCHILRDDGVTYNEYVTELTFLLFLKMMEETGREDVLPNGYRWSELAKRAGWISSTITSACLLDLGTKGKATRRRHLHRRANHAAQADQSQGAHRRHRQARLVLGARGRARQSLRRACWRRTPPRRNPARGNISRRAL